VRYIAVGVKLNGARRLMDSDQSTKRGARSLFERLAGGGDPLFEQLDRNAKSLLQSTLTRLDVVSREEFDAQTAVLQRTRERLEALEKQIEALNQELNQEQTANGHYQGDEPR
jgi:ubiquinone biosynthesis accessory factor UbiK